MTIYNHKVFLLTGLKQLRSKVHQPTQFPQYFFLTPCSSSFISCSVTFGVLSARRRQWTLSSGTRYSSTSLRGRPRARPCLDVEGTASSRMEPLRVFSWRQSNRRDKRKKIENARIQADFLSLDKKTKPTKDICCDTMEITPTTPVRHKIYTLYCCQTHSPQDIELITISIKREFLLASVAKCRGSL